MKQLLLLVLALIGPFAFAERPALMTYKNENDERRPVVTEKDWERRRQEILNDMQEVMGPLPNRNNLPPLE